MGTTLIGSPDTVAKGIEYLLELSKGGFGAMTFRANEWANREQIMKSYELFARYVAPRFQGQLETINKSNAFVKANRTTVLAGNVEAVKKAFTDTGREVPEEFAARTLGANDVKEAIK
jgi:limonene 1,2-monooxygenase